MGKILFPMNFIVLYVFGTFVFEILFLSGWKNAFDLFIRFVFFVSVCSLLCVSCFYYYLKEGKVNRKYMRIREPPNNTTFGSRFHLLENVVN